MSDIHFALGQKPETMALDETRELLAIQGAVAIATAIVEQQVSTFFDRPSDGGGFKDKMLEQVISSAKKSLMTEVSQERAD